MENEEKTIKNYVFKLRGNLPTIIDIGKGEEKEKIRGIDISEVMNHAFVLANALGSASVVDYKTMIDFLDLTSGQDVSENN